MKTHINDFIKIKVYNDEPLSLFPLHILTIGVNLDQPHIKRSHEHNQIFIVNSGIGMLNIGTLSFTLKKNDMFYINSNIPHEYYGIDDNFKTSFITFLGDGYEKIKKYYNLGDFGVYENKSNGLFKTVAEDLYNNIDTIHEFSTLCSMTFSSIISYFNEACKKELLPLEKVNNYIKENYSKMIILEDLLNIYPYSKAKLCHDYKEKYKMTIFEMLTSVRLNHAHSLIKASPYIALKDVALACGFNDASYFCKMYKRFYGYSPKSKIEY